MYTSSVDASQIHKLNIYTIYTSLSQFKILVKNKSEEQKKEESKEQEEALV